MHTRTIQGIIIHRAHGREADRIVTFLTRQGKLSAVAVSARKLTSRKTGILELFNEVRLILRETSNLPIIQEVELVATDAKLRKNLDGLDRVFWAAQLLTRLTHDNEATGELYDALRFYLRHLDRLSAVIEFELQLLRHLGWSPEVERCVVCREPLQPDSIVWCHGHGGVTHGSCRDTHSHEPISVNALKLLRFLLRHGVSRTVVRFDPSLQAEVEGLLERYLQVMSDQPELIRMKWTELEHDEQTPV